LARDRILVIGGGGREHALVWKLAQSPGLTAHGEGVDIICAPGNGGTAMVGKNVEGGTPEQLAQLAMRHDVALTIVGPEGPLAQGIVDIFRERGLPIFGSTRRASMLEASKVFSKRFMDRHGIPTAEFRVFTDEKEAHEFIDSEDGGVVVDGRCVVKADGLAGGKGAIVCRNRVAAHAAVELLMGQRSLGDAGDSVVIERMLPGEEATVLALTDGETVLPLVPSQDHKPVFDGDEGPNTGGMGAYAPAPVVTPDVMDRVMNDVLRPAVNGMRKEDNPFTGVLYAGLMIENGKPDVIEFNVRWGDPEAQAVIPLLESDLFEVSMAAAEGRLKDVELDWFDGAACCVVMASKNYPGKPEVGKLIDGMDMVGTRPDVVVFHAGTKRENNRYYTTSGRVLGVTGTGPDIRSAIDAAYSAVDCISFDGAHYRSDIGRRALDRLERG